MVRCECCDAELDQEDDEVNSCEKCDYEVLCADCVFDWVHDCEGAKEVSPSDDYNEDLFRDPTYKFNTL